MYSPTPLQVLDLKTYFALLSFYIVAGIPPQALRLPQQVLLTAEPSPSSLAVFLVQLSMVPLGYKLCGKVTGEMDGVVAGPRIGSMFRSS